MSAQFKTTGGARVGWVNATWPFAQLSSTSDRLTLEVSIAGTYKFAPNQVSAVEKYVVIPVLGWGIRIRHCVPDYPQKIVFWSFHSPEHLITRIRESGFHPTAVSAVADRRGGVPLRWQAIAVGALLGAAFLIDWLRAVNQWPESGRPFPRPGPVALFAAAALFALCITALRSSAVQSLLLKPGRSFGEISASVRLIAWIFAFATVFFLILILSTHVTPTA